MMIHKITPSLGANPRIFYIHSCDIIFSSYKFIVDIITKFFNSYCFTFFRCGFLYRECGCMKCILKSLGTWSGYLFKKFGYLESL